eukprot:4463276-Pleurochrysis_carterae.AAC.3
MRPERVRGTHRRDVEPSAPRSERRRCRAPARPRLHEHQPVKATPRARRLPALHDERPASTPQSSERARDPEAKEACVVDAQGPFAGEEPGMEHVRE